MKNFRLLTVGGYLSYRALFSWLNPTTYVFSTLIPSVTKVAFFVFLGRAAHVENDTYYVVGNALVAAASSCLFGMAQAISGERWSHTLSLLVVSPASRVAVFVGRALPATANGIFVSAWSLTVASLLFGISIPASAIPTLALAITLSVYSCVGLGLLNASLGLRWRETAVLGNILLYVLLIFAGVNIPLDRLPGWLSTFAQGLPITHGAEAARAAVAGQPFSEVGKLLAAELLVGSAYFVFGLATLRLFEREARRGATLELA